MAWLIVLLVVAPACGGETVLQRLLGGKIGSGNAKDIESSVVKIYVSASPPDLFSPWQKADVTSLVGSGVVIDAQRILTNAHVVEDAASIELKCSNMSQRYVAHVEYIDHDSDLALLVVEDEDFSQRAAPIELGQMPEAHAPIKAYGFPVGGETMCVTSGIISRIEVARYAHSWKCLLMAQIDAAINPGNSGGPVLADNQLVGIAVQSRDDAENVGYMIPVSVVRHFLEDIEDGRVDGFPQLGVVMQELNSPALRRSLGMSDSQTGSMVMWVEHGSPADGVLGPRDVLLEIEGKSVANDMTVAWADVGRVHFSEVVNSMQIGQEVTVRVLRGGEVLDRSITLSRHQRLVPGRRTRDLPQYVVFGGIVFRPLSLDGTTGSTDGYYTVLQYIYGDVVTRERNQIIIIQKVLPHPVNRGYESWQPDMVDTVNGVVPRDMEHLAAIIDGATGPYLDIVTAGKSVLALDLGEARAAKSTILANFGIAHDRSPDLRTCALASATQ